MKDCVNSRELKQLEGEKSVTNVSVTDFCCTAGKIMLSPSVDVIQYVWRCYGEDMVNQLNRESSYSFVHKMSIKSITLHTIPKQCGS